MGFEISEVNAANTNGVDDARALVESMRYKPIPPSRARVVILDEAHQLTNPAQNVLITETEDVSDHVYYIFCTSNISKIIPALQRRAYTIAPTPLNEENTLKLINKVKNHLMHDTELDAIANHVVDKNKFDNLMNLNVNEFAQTLIMNGVSSPGCVVQACEKFFAGVPSTECAVSNSMNPKIDSIGICRAVAAGNWTTVRALYGIVTKTDVHTLRACILGYLKTILLKNGKIQVAIAIKYVSEYHLNDDATMFLSSLCFACDQINK